MMIRRLLFALLGTCLGGLFGYVPAGIASLSFMERGPMWASYLTFYGGWAFFALFGGVLFWWLSAPQQNRRSGQDGSS
jgi:hypothetical protein